MAFRNCFSFEALGTGSSLLLADARWDAVESSLVVSGISTAYARTGTCSLVLKGSADKLCTAPMPISGAKACIGFAIYIPAASFAAGLNSTADFVQVRENTIVHGAVGLVWTSGNTFKLTVKRGTTVLATTSLSFNADTTYWMELSYTIDNATGAYELRMDGVTAATASSVDTQNAGTATWDRICFRSPFSLVSGIVYYDDVYVLDGSGGGPNNTLIGIQQVYNALLVADSISPGDFGESTPSTGTDRGALVDESPPNGDADYNTFPNGTTVKDAYVHAAFPISGTIAGVVVNVQQRKTDAGACTYRLSTRRAGTTTSGSTYAPLTTYSSIPAIFPLDPSTAAAWTVTNLNATQIQVDRVT